MISENKAVYGAGISSGPFSDNTTDPVVLTIINSAIIKNHANNGGGIANYSSRTVASKLTIISSTISENRGGGGGIDGEGNITITNSTISKNESRQNGGGIRIGSGLGFVTINNSTISENKIIGSGVGSNIYTHSFSNIPVNLKNTIIANDNLGNNCVGNNITSQGYNLANDNRVVRK